MFFLKFLEFSRLSHCLIVNELFSETLINSSVSVLVVCALAQATSLVYHTFSGLSTTFFIFFIWFFKERRKRDLNPRAAWTTYTLSRGTSSASWVFLHNWTSVQYSFCIKRIYKFIKSFCLCQHFFLFFLKTWYQFSKVPPRYVVSPCKNWKNSPMDLQLVKYVILIHRKLAKWFPLPKLLVIFSIFFYGCFI